MQDTAPTEPESGPQDEAVIAWQPVPTVIADAILGNVMVGGSYRITIAEFVLNPEPGAEHPMVRPVIALSMTPTALRHIADRLADIAGPAAPPEAKQDGG